MIESPGMVRDFVARAGAEHRKAVGKYTISAKPTIRAIRNMIYSPGSERIIVTGKQIGRAHV